jgi:hypothetical protein
VRWLSAVLILAGILGTSTLVRLWPADAVSPVLASRPIHLYEAPALRAIQEQLPTVRPVPLPAARIRPNGTGHSVRMESAVPQESAALTAAPPIPDEIAAAELPVDAPVSDDAFLVDEPVAPAVVSAPQTTALTAVAEATSPAPASSRGIVEVPAVAVGRAVTVAGRGIMTGLRATGAMFRAAF